MPSVTSTSLTDDPRVNGLLFGAEWSTDQLSFSFPQSASSYENGYGSGEPQRGFEAMNSAQKAAIRDVLDGIAAVCNLRFTEIAESPFRPADLRFAESDLPSTAWSYLPVGLPEGGDVWFNNSNEVFDRPVKGGYAYLAIIHEIGHSLGLKHPHEASGRFGAMPTQVDSSEYTVMSYRSYVGASASAGFTNEAWGFAQSLMMYDIAALQALYGADYGTESGDTSYRWSPTTGEMFIDGRGEGAPGANRVFQTIWDGGGIDSYDFSRYSTDLRISLAAGAWSRTSSTQIVDLHYDASKPAAGNIANALLHDDDRRSLIENATGGSGDDKMSGNGGRNTLSGVAGHDRLSGLGGRDRLEGGQGRDTLSGKADDDTLLGGNGRDILRGGAGDDSLVFKRPDQGADRISGFDSGHDTIRVDARGFGGGLAAGEKLLKGEGFIAGADPVATEAAGTFLYDRSGGTLMWDADGAGGRDAVTIARLAGHSDLTAGDILIV